MTRKVVATIASVALATFIVALVGPSLAKTDSANRSQNAARGEALFGMCKQCHGSDAGGTELFLAPAIAGLDQWYLQAQLEKFKSGARGLHPEDVGGLRMYPMSQWLRSAEDVVAVSEYVAAMPRLSIESTIEGGDAHKGETAYALCAACHGKEGEGNQQMNSPPLRGMSDWYLMTTMQKFKSGVRGSNTKNPTEMLMRGMALSLADEQALKDVIAHIMTLN